MKLRVGHQGRSGGGRTHGGGGSSSSGYWTPAIVSVLSLCLLAAAYNHRVGNFHKLRSAVLPQAKTVAAPVDLGPGGETPLQITRSSSTAGISPEFLSVTTLPGRGFQILQITAAIPGHGEVDLLHAPLPEDLDKVLNGTGADANGAHSTTLGGAFLAPWADRLYGTPSNGGNIDIVWNGAHYQVPADPAAGPGESTLGLMLGKTLGTYKSGLLPDGERAHADYPWWNFANHWPSRVEYTADVQMTGQDVDLTLTAKNVWTEPTPVGLGWQPLFNILSGHPENLKVTIPSSTRLVMGANGLPTGAEEHVSSDVNDFSAAGGTALGKHAIDVRYVGLQRGSTAGGPMIVLRDPEEDYGLRIILENGDADEVHLTSSSTDPWVTLGLSSNRVDPLGQEWKNGGGMRILQPGETMTWKVRLEIFSLIDSDSSSAF